MDRNFRVHLLTLQKWAWHYFKDIRCNGTKLLHCILTPSWSTSIWEGSISSGIWIHFRMLASYTGEDKHTSKVLKFLCIVSWLTQLVHRQLSLKRWVIQLYGIYHGGFTYRNHIFGLRKCYHNRYASICGWTKPITYSEARPKALTVLGYAKKRWPLELDTKGFSEVVASVLACKWYKGDRLRRVPAAQLQTNIVSFDLSQAGNLNYYEPHHMSTASYRSEIKTHLDL